MTDSPAIWFYEDDPGQAVKELEEFIGGKHLPQQLRTNIQAGLDDMRQVVIRSSTGDVLQSPTPCLRPNILVLK